MSGRPRPAGRRAAVRDRPARRRGSPAPRRHPLIRRLRADDGVATLALPMLLWVAVLVAVFAIDLGAYLVAAARAQALADAAALAAVQADVVGARRSGPAVEARRVTQAGDGRLERCDCTAGRERATVTVSVAVPGLVLPTLGASRVAADASAVLAPPDELAPGPTRERARWPLPATGPATGPAS